MRSTGTGAPAPSRAWYAASVSEAARDLEVDPQVGLSAAEASRRLAEAGHNRLAQAPREPRWRAFLRQFQDLMIIILLVPQW